MQARADDKLAAYVRARAAAADGAVRIAAAGYAAALADQSGNEVIAIRAFREALAAGDYALARRAAAVLEQSKVAPMDAAILSFADALAKRDYAAARAATKKLARGPLDFMGPVLQAWLTLDTGKGDPFELLESPEANALTRRYAAENRALLLIATGRIEEGADALRTLLGNDQGSLDLRLNAAALLAGKGRERLAGGLLEGNDPVLAAYREDLGDGAEATAAFGASRLFTRLAVDLGREETAPLSIMLARSALLLDPEDDRARLLLADALSQEQAIDPALAVLDAIDPDGIFGHTARAARVTVLRRAGRDEAALAAARALAEAPGATSFDAQNYGDLLVGEERYAEAAAAYAVAMERASGGPDWILYLQRGGALEQAGRWKEALPLLEKAVELAPEQAVALNYLGYTQVERGVNLAEARRMLEKASALRPDDPSITDSLAWAYFKLGEVRKAVPLLEKAVRGEPGDVTINEHLGDAYWTVGRRYEARYAWRAAAVYADGEDAKRLAAKLASGLSEVTAAR